ncbi:Zinc finger CCCH domain-containing protein [Drosera capensis]
MSNSPNSTRPPPQSPPHSPPSLESESGGPIIEENEAGEEDVKEEVVVEEERRGEEKGYPVREGVEDCAFYMRTGTCKFGMACRFNHPIRAKGSAVKVKEKDEQSEIIGQADRTKEKDEHLERTGTVTCKYYDRPGGCKYGKACRFNHNKKNSTARPTDLNFMGLPIRPGEKECPYYSRTGSCKYGGNCRFHHPKPTAAGESDFVNGGPMPSMSAWSVPAHKKDTCTYVPLMFLPAQGAPSNHKWSSYGAPVYAPQRSSLLSAPQGANYLPKSGMYAQHPQIIDEFPERPGQPECSYFMRTGNCKYRSACKFHHPKSGIANPSSCTLSVVGLPLRPGQNICSHYSRYGICKFGPECKYDHPDNYGAMAPSMPGLSHPLSFGFSTNNAMMVGVNNGS